MSAPDVRKASGREKAGEQLSPLDRVQRSAGASPWVWAVAVLTHVAGAGAVVSMPPVAREPLVAAIHVTHMVEVDLTPPPPPPPPPTPEPELEEPKAPPVEKAPPRRIKRPAAPPPPKAPEPEPEPEPVAEVQAPAPEAAAAPEVLTQDAPTTPAPQAPQIVSGTQAVPLVGGQSAVGGTAHHAVRGGQARVGGVEGATGTAAVDRTRPPRLAGGARWDCPWPEEGDMVDEDEPVVTLRVRVTATGAVRQVTVVKDPGYGFGREARRCAMRKRWQPALDPSGQPTENVALVAVRFSS